MSRIRRKYEPEKVLKNWRVLVSALPKMNEDEVVAALNRELLHTAEPRKDFIRRIYHKYARLRQARELKGYLGDELI